MSKILIYCSLLIKLLSAFYTGSYKRVNDGAISTSVLLLPLMFSFFFLFSYLLCQQLSDFPRLEPEPQQLHLKSDAALLPIHAGRSNGSCSAALQHVSHGDESELCRWARIGLEDRKALVSVWFEFAVRNLRRFISVLRREMTQISLNIRGKYSCNGIFFSCRSPSGFIYSTRQVKM